MFNIGAFAGGLAQGIRSGQNMGLRQKQGERTAQADEREAEMHQARMDKAISIKDKRDRLRAANDEIVEGWRQSYSQPPLRSTAFKPDQPGPGTGAPVETGQGFKQSDELFSTGGLQSEVSAAPTDNRLAGSTASAGLMSQYRNPVARKNTDKAQAAPPADEIIGRRMLTGDLLENPDELTRMAGIYKKHGLLMEMTPWMNKAFEAKKKRIPDALSYLLMGDAKGAREILKKGGVNLTDDPVPANSEYSQSNHIWRFRMEDGGEQEVNVWDVAKRFFPEKSLEENRE
ncbi:MAG: hypothetical protein H0U72_04475 [Nitrosospira sp.]|nr:hypothetical protein [Nitrosospira sp.]